MIEFSIYGALFAMVLCAILLPIAGLISSGFVNLKECFQLAGLTIIGYLMASVCLLVQKSDELVATAFILFGLSFVLPTAYYFYCALMKHLEMKNTNI